MLPAVSTQVPPAERLRDTAVAHEVEQLIGKFAHQPDVLIRDSAEGVIPGATAADGISGAVYDGKIHLFLDQFRSLSEARRVVFHELLHAPHRISSSTAGRTVA